MSKSKKRRSKKKAPPSLNTVPRNPYVDHPLMQKGGVHQKSKSANRAAARREVKQLARDWSSYFYTLFFKLIFKFTPY